MAARLKQPDGPREAGVTLVELVSVTAIVLLLAGMAIPVANTMVKRKKELELRRALRDIRIAIDRFQADADRFPQMCVKFLNCATNEEKYPEKLEWLYEGLDIGPVPGLQGTTVIKWMRRLPRDPITGKKEWATRSSRDRPDSLFSDGINIFDVRSTSNAVALNGTRYSEW